MSKCEFCRAIFKDKHGEIDSIFLNWDAKAIAELPTIEEMDSKLEKIVKNEKKRHLIAQTAFSMEGMASVMEKGVKSRITKMNKQYLSVNVFDREYDKEKGNKLFCEVILTYYPSLKWSLRIHIA